MQATLVSRPRNLLQLTPRSITSAGEFLFVRRPDARSENAVQDSVQIAAVGALDQVHRLSSIGPSLKVRKVSQCQLYSVAYRLSSLTLLQTLARILEGDAEG